MSTVRVRPFYTEWSGHRIEHLDIALQYLRGGSTGEQNREVLFLAGDSTLDNKYWILHTPAVDAINGYEKFLRPARMMQDVSYWINRELLARGQGERAVCLNTAIEATTLGERSRNLLPQDQFIRHNITSRDALIVSVGGNDIALKPSFGTIVNMLRLVKCTSTRNLEVTSATPKNKIPGGYHHFIRLFRDDIRTYIMRMTDLNLPKLVVVCLVYYPDEQTTGSWADFALGCMGYNKDPAKLQLMIRTIFEIAVREIEIPGTKVVAFPLFSVMDGKNTHDYEQRVEPSVQGGRKMATGICEAWMRECEGPPATSGGGGGGGGGGGAATPQSSAAENKSDNSDEDN